MSIDRSTTEAAAFRDVYQAVVDRTPVAADLEDIQVWGLASEVAVSNWTSRGWIAALVGAVAVAVAVGGVALLTRTGTAPSTVADTPSVTGPFVVMEDPSSVLGSDVRVTFKETGGVDAELPFSDVQMRLWAREEAAGFTQAVTLLEGDPDADLIVVAGLVGIPGPTIEYEGRQFLLVEAEEGSFFNESVALQWDDDLRVTRSLLVTQGFTREEALAMAGVIADQGDVSAGAIPDGLDLEYEGPQVLTPPPGSIFRELVYNSDVGNIQVVAVEGWVLPEAGSLLRSSDARRVEVGDSVGVLSQIDFIEWVVVWTDDDSVTYVVQTRELTPDQSIAAARQVRSVSQDEWDAIAVEPTAPTDTEDQPTANSFSAVTEPSVVASGNGWTVSGQVVEKTQGRTSPGNRGVCAWLERDTKTMIDLGCDFNTTGHPGYWPTFSTPDGVVMIASMPIEASTVRIEIDTQEPIEAVTTRFGNASTSALFVLEFPLKNGTALITIYDDDGNQLDADPQNDRLDLNMPLEPAE